MRTILHFQEKLQKRLCCAGRSEAVTLDRARVTCRNCLEKLKLTVRQQFNAKVDWDTLYKQTKTLLPKAKKELLEFGLAHPWCNYDFGLENFPPRLWFEFWLQKKPADRRVKTVGIDRRAPKTWTMGNVVHVYIPNEEETNTIANFVGQLSESLSLRAKRTNGDSPILSYELKPKYDERN